MKKRSTSLESIRQQLVVLRNRVSFLERALRKARATPRELAGIARRRDQSEDNARRAALEDYHADSQAKRYRQSPWILKVDQEVEDSRNAFLRSRGLRPDPTEIPKEFRRQARRLVNKKSP